LSALASADSCPLIRRKSGRVQAALAALSRASSEGADRTGAIRACLRAQPRPRSVFDWTNTGSEEARER